MLEAALRGKILKFLRRNETRRPSLSGVASTESPRSKNTEGLEDEEVHVDHRRARHVDGVRR
jgi:hypothetical protein